MRNVDILGEANVLQAFMVTEKNKKIPVAGCRCFKGQLNRKKRFKVIRNEEVILDGKLIHNDIYIYNVIKWNVSVLYICFRELLIVFTLL